jgi:hypothetical protein
MNRCFAVVAFVRRAEVFAGATMASWIATSMTRAANGFARRTRAMARRTR